MADWNIVMTKTHTNQIKLESKLEAILVSGGISVPKQVMVWRGRQGDSGKGIGYSVGLPLAEQPRVKLKN